MGGILLSPINELIWSSRLLISIVNADLKNWKNPYV